MEAKNQLDKLVRFGVKHSRKAIRKAGEGRGMLQVLAVVAAALTGGPGPGTEKSKFWDAT